MTKRDSRRDRFVRLAEKRMVKAIRSIRLVGNLSNKTHYDFSHQDVKKILQSLNAELAHVERRFKEITAKDGVSFKL